MSQYVRLKDGMPTLQDFLSNEGSPLVINTLTGVGYYLRKNIIMELVSGTVTVANAFSLGFSDGFANGP